MTDEQVRHFWIRVEIPSDPNACWEWRGPFSSNGYGSVSITFAGRTVSAAHRIAYERAFGPIPQGKEVCHKCDNPKCCRPDHLFLGTHRDNLRDAMRKGRIRRKISKQDELDIQAAIEAGQSITKIAEQYAVSRAAIYNHVKGQQATCAAFDVYRGEEA